MTKKYLCKPGVILPTALLISLLAVIVIGGGVLGYYLATHPAITINTNSVVTLQNNNSSAATNTSANNTNSLPSVPAGDVVWQTPKEITQPSLTITTSISPTSGEAGAKVRYYTIGTFTQGKYDNDSLILATVPCNCPDPYPAMLRFIQHDNALVLLAKNSDVTDFSQYSDYPVDAKKFTVDQTSEISDLKFPETIQGPEVGQTLQLDKFVRAIFKNEGLTKVFTDPVYGAVYTKYAYIDPAVANTNTNANSSQILAFTDVYNRNGFYLQAPDGTLRVFTLKVPFVSSTSPTAITWNDGTKNPDNYSLSDIGGCGGTNYVSLIDSAKLSLTADLKIAGQTSDGQTIYEFKNEDHAFLKNYYNNTYQVFEGSKVPYATFLKAHPIVFWVDPFDRLVKLQDSSKYGPAAECGKPVIYLYPQETTDVSIKLQPQGGFTYTEPDYGNGWTVKADPSGKLTELSSGKTYPYLFWEGRGGIYQSPTQGFMVAKNDVHQFLTTSLSKLGLNSKETADFLEFWEPRMRAKPYYFVSFLGTRIMDQIAPLTITPKPDTIIRVLMDFKGLDQPYAVQGYDLKAIPRRGFTVIEWGGVIQ